MFFWDSVFLESVSSISIFPPFHARFPDYLANLRDSSLAPSLHKTGNLEYLL